MSDELLEHIALSCVLNGSSEGARMLVPNSIINMLDRRAFVTRWGGELSITEKGKRAHSGFKPDNLGRQEIPPVYAARIMATSVDWIDRDLFAGLFSESYYDRLNDINFPAETMLQLVFLHNDVPEETINLIFTEPRLAASAYSSVRNMELIAPKTSASTLFQTVLPRMKLSLVKTVLSGFDAPNIAAQLEVNAEDRWFDDFPFTKEELIDCFVQQGIKKWNVTMQETLTRKDSSDERLATTIFVGLMYLRETESVGDPNITACTVEFLEKALTDADMIRKFVSNDMFATETRDETILSFMGKLEESNLRYDRELIESTFVEVKMARQ